MIGHGDIHDDRADEGHKSAGEIEAFCRGPPRFVDLTI